MINKPKWPSEMNEAELVAYMGREFNLDAQFRETTVGAEATYAECVSLYESIGLSNDGTDIPQLPLIREPVNDAIALASGINSRVKLKPLEVIDSGMAEDERDFFLQQIHQASETNNRHVETMLFASQFQDHRAKAIKHAGMFGVGAILFQRDGVIDVRASQSARRLRYKNVSTWDEADWKVAHMLANNTKARHVDSRSLYFRRGVTSYYSPEMTRAWIYEKKNYQDVVAKNPGKDIRPGTGRWGLTDANYLNAQDKHVSVGELEMFEVEIHPITKTSPSGASVAMFDYKMVHAKMAGSKLLFKKVHTSADGILSLPIVTYYLMESENHPYGFSMARALKIVAEYINSMYYAAFAQAKKSISPQSIAILVSKLAKVDSVEEMTQILRDGDVLQLHGAAGVESINEIVQPVGQMAAQLAPATLQAIGLGKELLYRHASSPNRDAISRTDSGRGKEAELTLADRGNSMMTDTIARSDEAIWDMAYEHIQVFYKNTMSVPIRNAQGKFESVTINEPAVELLPINDPITGEPMVSESFKITGVNDEGYQFKRATFVKNSTSINMVAEAELRSEIPTSWEARFNMFIQLAQLPGLLRSQRTARDFILPDSIAAKDDVNWEKDQKVLQEQAVQQAMMASGMDPNTNKPIAGGPTQEQQLQNAITGRNTPQPNGALRNANQDMALQLQSAAL